MPTTLARPTRERTRTGRQWACYVCALPSNGQIYTIDYGRERPPRGPGTSPRFYLCNPHASALSVSHERPVRLVRE